MNDNGYSKPGDEFLETYVLSDRWWYSGARVAALILLANALALTWLLLFGAVPRETLAWFVDWAFWVLALILGVARWPAS